jgi:4-amino-4-deoxy-L-arabinose transferase-like glycosyltransferase
VLVVIGLVGARHRQAARLPRQAPAGGAPDRPRSGASVWAVLVVLTVVALALRLWRLDSCLWFDEVLTLVDFVRMPVGRILTTFPSQNQHMLFSILAHASITTLGESAWTLRLPSVLFGVASLWPLFFLGRRIVGVREALLACALMTVSYHHVWFSENARGYMGLMFFATLATWLWLEALAQSGWGWWLAYAAVLALGMSIHMTMVFVPAAHAPLYALSIIRSRSAGQTPGRSKIRAAAPWKPLFAWILAGTLTLQLYALSLPQFFQTALHEESLPSEWTNSMWVIVESARSLTLGFGIQAVVVGGAVVAAVGWLSIIRRDWMAGAAIVLPAVLGGTTMLVLSHNLWPRFFFFSIGFALLIAVHGTMTACRKLAATLQAREGVGMGAGVALTSLAIAASALSLPRAYALPKQDFTGARDYVESSLSPGDAVVAVGLAGFAYQRYFAPNWQVVQTRAELDAVRRSHPRVWLVYTLPIEVKTYRPEIWDAIQEDFEIDKVFPGTLGDGAVNVCRERQEMMVREVR